jgi:hypothetical protein
MFNVIGMDMWIWILTRPNIRVFNLLVGHIIGDLAEYVSGLWSSIPVDLLYV